MSYLSVCHNGCDQTVRGLVRQATCFGSLIDYLYPRNLSLFNSAVVMVTQLFWVLWSRFACSPLKLNLRIESGWRIVRREVGRLSISLIK